MTVYIDLVCIINFIYDFLILLTVSFTLKRNRKIYYYILSSLIGVLSIFLLFLKINNIVLFLLKILISVIMVIVAFGYKSIKYTISNIIYFYMTSIILAGFLYLIKGNNFNLNYIVLLIIGPIILFIYYKSNKKLKNTYSDYYKIKIVFDNIEYNLVSFYDNGNILKDPVSRKSIIIVGNNRLEKILNYKPNSMMEAYI